MRTGPGAGTGAPGPGPAARPPAPPGPHGAGRKSPAPRPQPADSLRPVARPAPRSRPPVCWHKPPGRQVAVGIGRGKAVDPGVAHATVFHKLHVGFAADKGERLGVARRGQRGHGQRGRQLAQKGLVPPVAHVAETAGHGQRGQDALPRIAHDVDGQAMGRSHGGHGVGHGPGFVRAQCGAVAGGPEHGPGARNGFDRIRVPGQGIGREDRLVGQGHAQARFQPGEQAAVGQGEHGALRKASHKRPAPGRIRQTARIGRVGQQQIVAIEQIGQAPVVEKIRDPGRHAALHQHRVKGFEGKMIGEAAVRGAQHPEPGHVSPEAQCPQRQHHPRLEQKAAVRAYGQNTQPARARHSPVSPGSLAFCSARPCNSRRRDTTSPGSARPPSSPARTHNSALCQR